MPPAKPRVKTISDQLRETIAEHGGPATVARIATRDLDDPDDKARLALERSLQRFMKGTHSTLDLSRVDQVGAALNLRLIETVAEAPKRRAK